MKKGSDRMTKVVKRDVFRFLRNRIGLPVDVNSSLIILSPYLPITRFPHLPINQLTFLEAGMGQGLHRVFYFEKDRVEFGDTPAREGRLARIDAECFSDPIKIGSG